MPDEEPKKFERFYDWLSKDGYTVEERRTLRKSWVRIVVTVVAALYLFWGGFKITTMLLDPSLYSITTTDDTGTISTMGTMLPNARAAVDMFMYLVPIASGILAFWFASRGTESTGTGK